MLLQVKEVRNFHTFLPILPLLVWPTVLASSHANSQTIYWAFCLKGGFVLRESLLLYCACLIDLLRVEDFGLRICVLNAQRANAANERGSLGLLRKKNQQKKGEIYDYFWWSCVLKYSTRRGGIVPTLMALMEKETKQPWKFSNRIYKVISVFLTSSTDTLIPLGTPP